MHPTSHLCMYNKPLTPPPPPPRISCVSGTFLGNTGAGYQDAELSNINPKGQYYTHMLGMATGILSPVVPFLLTLSTCTDAAKQSKYYIKSFFLSLSLYTVL